MSKETGSDTIQSIGSAAAQQQNQIQLTVDDSQASTMYGANFHMWNSMEEMIVDLAGPVRPTGPKSAVMKIQQRVIFNPYKAKLLAMMVSQWVHQYEQAYGTIELDERRRRINPPPMGQGPTPQA